MNTLEYALNKHPLIASLTEFNNINIALESNSKIIILINSDIRIIKKVTEKAQKNDKLIFVHIDLMKGLKRDFSGLDFLSNVIGVDGIVTTNKKNIQLGKRLGLLTIQRIFILDSASIVQGIDSIKETCPDAVEILPGVSVPHIINKITKKTDSIIIAAGLIDTQKEIQHILQSGAHGISSSSINLWKHY